MAASTAGTATATATGVDRPHKANGGYALAGGVAALAGWLIGTKLVSQPPTFHAFTGNTFALVYVLAQAVERAVEVSLSIIDGIATSFDREPATTTKSKALRSLAAAPAEESQQADKDTVEKAESNTRALAFGLSVGLAFVACGYFEISLLNLIGVGQVPEWVDRFVSGLIVAGGSKPLHDLISKIQKSKQKDEQATG